ncbi:MAG: hypothetical protein ACU0CO_07165 [Shimia sp.]
MGFRADQSGAVTIDWVVLTAALVGLGVAVAASVGGGATTRSTKIATCLGAMGQTVKTDSVWFDANPDKRVSYMGDRCHRYADKVQ